MADESTNTTATDTTVNDGAATDTTAADNNAANVDENVWPEDAKAFIDKIRKEAAANDKRAKDAEAKVKAAEDAKLSEQERTNKELEEARTRIAQFERESFTNQARADLVDLATKNGAIAPRAVADILVAKVTGNEYDAAALLAEGKKDYPELFKSARGSADAGAGKTTTSADDTERALRAAFGR